MLVLTRKSKQSIMIGDDIEITVLKIERDQVRIGIAAPHSIPVHRKEVYNNIHKDHPDAPSSEPKDQVM
ncbi:MAG: carbon storage regulator CsrA [Planctomycetes bacterium]|nr:carbon storage regulator CsrA [Planctomycetota bacterium]